MRRNRWSILFSALPLFWGAWWYCNTSAGGAGLLQVAVALTFLALLRARSVPGTSRWLIWGTLLLVVICLAANVERLVPPSDAPDESRVVDRVVTVFFAFGLATLFFRATAAGVTILALGVLPSLFLVLARLEGTPLEVSRQVLLIALGLLLLLTAADQAQRITIARSESLLAAGGREQWWRVLILLVLGGAALLARQPLDSAARYAQRAFYGWIATRERHSGRRLMDLNIALSPSLKFGRQKSPVALVESGTPIAPGYLRETVYQNYRHGRWEVIRPTRFFSEAVAEVLAPKQQEYLLRPLVEGGHLSTWRVTLLRQRAVNCFCLPGGAIRLGYHGLPLLAESNGVYKLTGDLPNEYKVLLAARSVSEAWQYPKVSGEWSYREVPEFLRTEVDAWLLESGVGATNLTVPQVVAATERFFHAGFNYRLGVKLDGTRDPLVAFMGSREGACGLFASAAALIYRQRGVPARVVAGYHCSDWNPWIERWVVRARDAHVWVEVWDEARGRWLLSDPTPPEGCPSAWPKSGRWRWSLDWLMAKWSATINYLKHANFLEVIADIGELLVVFVVDVFWSLPGALALLAVLAVVWWRRRVRLSRMTASERLRLEMVGAMRRVERRAVPARARRGACEPWSVWLSRVAPLLVAARAAELAQLLDEYQELRYSARLDEARCRAWLRRARADKRASRARD